MSNNIIPFELGQVMLEERVWLTPYGAAVARDCRVPSLTLVDPEDPPFPIQPMPGADDVEIQPSDEDSVVCLIVIRVNGREKIVAKVWDDGLVRTFDGSFGPDTGALYVRAIQTAYQIVGGGACVSS